MKNSEAIKELKHQVYKNTDNCEMKISKDCYKAITNALEENDKLKAEIEQFADELISVRIENELLKKKNELTNYYFEQYAAAIDEIEQLKAELEKSVRLPFTNADKIRSMSDEELAEFIQDIWCDNHGYFVNKLLSKSANPICILEMLKSEVPE